MGRYQFRNVVTTVANASGARILPLFWCTGERSLWFDVFEQSLR